VAFGSVWVTNYDDATVTRIDPRTNRVIATVRADGGSDDIVAGQGSIWVSHAWTVSRIDPERNQTIAKIGFDLGTTLSSITVADGFVWVVGQDGRVYRVSPATNKIEAIIRAGPYSLGSAAGEGAVWVVNGRPPEPNGTVSRIDPKTNQVVATIAVGTYPWAVAVGGGYVWVSNLVSRTVSRIDPGTNQVAETMMVSKSPRRVAYGDGALWFTSGDDHTVTRVKP